MPRPLLERVHSHPVRIHNSQASIVIEDFVEDFVQRADRSHEVASRAEARRDVLGD